jgi:hypothetical protein
MLSLSERIDHRLQTSMVKPISNSVAPYQRQRRWTSPPFETFTCVFLFFRPLPDAAFTFPQGEIECEGPSARIESFVARLRPAPGAELVSLSASQLLLQATHLRNTRWVYGVAVYTGAPGRRSEARLC